MSPDRGRIWLAFIPIALLAIASVVAVRTSDTHIVAYFPSAAGLYKGDKVKVMGVAVGRVRSVEPDGDRVRVELAIDSQPIPADARAAIVAPSLVSERFVQLAPAYKRGPEMASGDVIPVGRTAIPVSFDEVKHELTDLATALGPEPGRPGDTGSLNRAIRTLDANLGGNSAEELRESLAAMRGATTSLAAGGDDLFTTLHNLNLFVKNLDRNDRAARQLTNDMAEVTGFLDDNRHELGSAIAGLADVLKIVRDFVDDDGPAVETAVLNLEKVARTVASRSSELGGFLHASPTAVSDLYNMVDGRSITARVMVATNLQDLSQLLCGAIFGIGGTVAECKAAFAPLVEALKLSPITAASVAGDGRSGDGAEQAKPQAAGSSPAGLQLDEAPLKLPLLDGLRLPLSGLTR